jgi:hypothetical protein
MMNANVPIWLYWGIPPLFVQPLVNGALDFAPRSHPHTRTPPLPVITPSQPVGLPTPSQSASPISVRPFSCPFCACGPWPTSRRNGCWSDTRILSSLSSATSPTTRCLYLIQQQPKTSLVFDIAIFTSSKRCFYLIQ